jgi:Kdo2-lipid IVA lauroyltransferase/acyltransferase
MDWHKMCLTVAGRWDIVSGRGGDVATVESSIPRWRRWRRLAYGLLTRAAIAGVGALPPVGGRAVCRGLAWLGLIVRPRERRRAVANLQRALPEMRSAQRRRFLWASASALGETLHATLTAPRIAAGGFREVRDDEAAAAVCRSLIRPGRGALLLTGHLGCWELLGAWLAAQLGPVGVVTGTVHNPAVDDLLQARRRRLGMTPLPREAGIRPVLRELAAGHMVGVLLDQRTRAASVPVPFFGRPAPTPVALAKLALHWRLPVLPAAMVREDGAWVVRTLAPLLPPADADPRSEAHVTAFTQRCTEALESLIRRNPAQWVWFHDRWGDDC